MTGQYTGLSQLMARVGEGALSHALLETVGHDLVILDEHHCISFCGNGLAELLDYSPGELQGRYLYELLAPTVPEIDVVQVAGDGRALDAVLPYVFARKDGAIVHVTCANRTVLGVDGRMACTLFTLQNPTIEAGDQSLLARSAVLEEHNHRVRNNLAIICALLDMEIGHARSTPEHGRLLMSLARTRSLALVHSLAQDAEGCLDVGMLAQGVADSVCPLYNATGNPINLRVHSPIFLNARRAVNLALALTEIIAPLAHCTSHQSSSEASMEITLQEKECTLIVEGPACSHCAACGFTPLGRDILTGLIERSLRGQLEVLASSPLRATLHFPVGETR